MLSCLGVDRGLRVVGRWSQNSGIFPSSKIQFMGFPGGTVVKKPPANAGDTGSSPGPGRSHMLWSN